MQTILRPFVVSTSEYNSPDVDWSVPIDPPVSAVLCRASIGTPEWMGTIRKATDQSFPHYWPQWDRLKWCRCAYHFLMNGAGASAQAKWFVKCVNAAGGFHAGDRICLDAEDSRNLSITEIVDFFYNVSLLIPTIPISHYLLYSRANLLNPLKFSGLTTGQKQFLLKIPQWTAGYPDNMSGWTFESLAHNYQADILRYGPTAIVQYQASATIPGISLPDYLSVECNAIDPAYLAKWQKEVSDYYGTTPPIPPVPSSVSSLGVFMQDGSQKTFKVEAK